jgi:hypothetical protein
MLFKYSSGEAAVNYVELLSRNPSSHREGHQPSAKHSFGTLVEMVLRGRMTGCSKGSRKNYTLNTENEMDNMS